MKTEARRAAPGAGALALMGLLGLCGELRGQSAGSQVYEALRTAPRVRVVIALREPQAPATSLALRAGEVDHLERAVLGGLGPEEFRITHRFVSFPALAGELSAAGVEKLLRDPDVLRVDLDVPMSMNLAESVPLIKADAVHNMGVTGRGVTVAVLDTGIDANHPDLKDSLTAEQCFCANADGSGCCPNGATSQSGAGAARDEQGHGTNVAGIITSAGHVAPLGVAPDASIVAVRVLDKAGSASSTTQLLSGLDWVMTNHPEVKVVNLSLGTANLFPGTCDSAASFTMAFQSAISALRSRGALTFSSSANNANATAIAVPACVSSSVAVGATYDASVGTVSFGCTDSTTAADRIACFSNSSSKVDLLAPGGAITSTGMGGGTSTFFGTSQACPHAAGAAALLLSAKPGLTPDQIEAALKNTGVPIADSRNGLTFKRIDVQAALAAAGN